MRLDYQILLKSLPPTSLVGSALVLQQSFDKSWECAKDVYACLIDKAYILQRT